MNTQTNIELNNILYNKNLRNNQNYIVWTIEKKRIINIKLLLSNNWALAQTYMMFWFLCTIIFIFIFTTLINFIFKVDFVNYANWGLFWPFWILSFGVFTYLQHYYSYNNNINCKKFILIKKYNKKILNYEELIQFDTKNREFISTNYFISNK